MTLEDLQRERLERLPKFRKGPSALNFTISGMPKAGGKGTVVLATLKRGMWGRKSQVAVKKLRVHQDMNSHMFENVIVKFPLV